MLLTRLIKLRVLGCLVSANSAAQNVLVLNERVMEISRVSARLSTIAYAPVQVSVEQFVSALDASSFSADLSMFTVASTTSARALPNYIHYYTREPDQAIVARYEGRCYISFRGTKLNADDWGQNIDIGNRLIYRNGDTLQPSCESRRGYGDFLRTPEVIDGRNDVISCVEECIAAGSDPEDCLVITGHSQGGATATIASILLFDQLPTVVTFGQPPAVDPDCEWIPSERFYRYVNSKVESGEDDDLAFDAVPFSLTFISGSTHYGYYLMLGDDGADGKTSNIKFMGFGEDEAFDPDLVDLGIAPHAMAGEEYSYEGRILALIENGVFPVPIEGFSPGTVCEEEYRILCASKRCKDHTCQVDVHSESSSSSSLPGHVLCFVVLLVACTTFQTLPLSPFY